MKRKHIYIVLAIAGVAGLSFWLTREPRQSTSGSAVKTASATGIRLTVNAKLVEGQSFSNTITLSGTIEPDEQVQIRSEISGVIRELAFREGTFVQKGQLLFRTDDTELQAQLRQAQTREILDAENERRARLLLEKEAISSQEYDVAKANYESSRAQTALIEAQLAKTRVYAPFSGNIGLRSVSVGEYLTPTTVVANLLSTGRVKVQFSIPEKYSGMVRSGHAIRVRATNVDRDYEATVYAIEPGVDETTRTIRIRAIADNKDGHLVPGAFARVELPLDRLDDAILIPTYAVVPVQDGKQVYLYRNGQATMVPVETENRTSNDVLVTAGVTIGDTLITSGLLSIRDGMPVDVRIIE